MRDNHFVVLVFFSIFSLIMTTIFSGVIIYQNGTLKSKLENALNNNNNNNKSS